MTDYSFPTSQLGQMIWVVPEVIIYGSSFKFFLTREILGKQIKSQPILYQRYRTINLGNLVPKETWIVIISWFRDYLGGRPGENNLILESVNFWQTN